MNDNSNKNDATDKIAHQRKELIVSPAILSEAPAETCRRTGCCQGKMCYLGKHPLLKMGRAMNPIFAMLCSVIPETNASDHGLPMPFYRCRSELSHTASQPSAKSKCTSSPWPRSAHRSCPSSGKQFDDQVAKALGDTHCHPRTRES